MNNNRLSSNLKNELINLTSLPLQDTVDINLKHQDNLQAQIKPNIANTLNYNLLASPHLR